MKKIEITKQFLGLIKLFYKIISMFTIRNEEYIKFTLLFNPFEIVFTYLISLLIDNTD